MKQFITLVGCWDAFKSDIIYMERLQNHGVYEFGRLALASKQPYKLKFHSQPRSLALNKPIKIIFRKHFHFKFLN